MSHQLMTSYYHKAIDTNDVVELKRLFAERPGEAVNEQMFIEAILLGNLEIVKCLFENGCPRYRDRTCFERAINKGHVEIVKYLYEVGLVWDDINTDQAIWSGNLDLLKFMLEHQDDEDMIIDSCVPSIYSSIGNLECLRYLLERGYSASMSVYTEACRKNRLYILKFLHENKFGNIEYLRQKWSHIYHCVYSLDIIKYLYEVMMIPWGEYKISYSVIETNKEIITYMLDNGCPMDEASTERCLELANMEVLLLLLERGCPIRKDISLDKLKVKESTIYYHDNIYDRELCNKDCHFCVLLKQSTLWYNWELINEDFQSYIQWLPREILEDVDSFII